MMEEEERRLWEEIHAYRHWESNLSTKIHALLAYREKRYREVVEALIGDGRFDAEYNVCGFCGGLGASSGTGSSYEWYVAHTEDCPWVQARLWLAALPEEVRS